jgi:hypothetical protein
VRLGGVKVAEMEVGPLRRLAAGLVALACLDLLGRGCGGQCHANVMRVFELCHLCVLVT